MPPSGVHVPELELLVLVLLALVLLDDAWLELELEAPPIPLVEPELELDEAPVPLLPHANDATVNTPIVVNAKVSGR